MKRIVTETVLSLITYTLIAVVVSSVYLSFVDLAEILRENPDGFDITINFYSIDHSHTFWHIAYDLLV